MKLNITENEFSFIKSLVDHNEYGEKGNLDNCPWSWAVTDSKHKKAGTLGSLVKKGYCGQDGKGEDATCWLTEEGKKAYLIHFGAYGINPSTFPDSAPNGVVSKSDILGDIFFLPE